MFLLIMILEVNWDNLIINDDFIVPISRKIKKTKKKLIIENDLYGVEGPCPPGIYYIFYRLRESGDRLELCQEKPKELFTFNHEQGILFSEKGTKRTNIQIHLGTKSKGCILISKKHKDLYWKLLKLVSEKLNKKEIIKIKVDDYWK